MFECNYEYLFVYCVDTILVHTGTCVRVHVLTLYTLSLNSRRRSTRVHPSDEYVSGAEHCTSCVHSLVAIVHYHTAAAVPSQAPAAVIIELHHSASVFTFNTALNRIHSPRLCYCTTHVSKV